MVVSRRRRVRSEGRAKTGGGLGEGWERAGRRVGEKVWAEKSGLRRRPAPDTYQSLTAKHAAISVIIDYSTLLGGFLHTTPVLAPTVAPLGSERLIAVRYVLDGEVQVHGSVTGRSYHFAGGQSREIPLADARVMVSNGDFAFSGGR